MNTREESLQQYAARKLAKYDSTANDAISDVEESLRRLRGVYGPLAAAALEDAKEVVGIADVSHDDESLRSDLLTGIREREAYKWYAMAKAGISAKKISSTSRSNVSTIEDSVRQVEDCIKLSLESQEETGTKDSS